ncbi:ATP-dependent nuclease [Nitrospina watsonii]|uniref:ATP-dependent nuclease n=1 Tax=Nitrospina watsonii TaxID=1323948 RepID=UPI00249152A9|nr:DUF2813 domain-containing protein [Nitrospina watsonii]
MFLQKIAIENFRGIKNLTVELDDTTVFIGENNTGKSSILDALQICLARSLTRKGGIFGEYDYHLPNKNSQPSDCEPIEIVLTFTEQSESEWPDEVAQILADAIQIDDNGLQSIILDVKSRYDETIKDFDTTWDFLDLKGNPLPKAKNPRLIIQLQQLSPMFYLAALRDVAQEFRPKSQFWGPFVRSLKIDAQLREELEQSLSELNQRVLDAHESFDSVRERLKKAGDLVPLDPDDPVGIEAIPGKVFDMLSRTQVMLTSKAGARLPIGRHGEGTQSLAVICLFDAFLQSRLKEGYGDHAVPILALEEPEAHLHPSAIRSVAGMLNSFKGQKLISTHSGDLVSGIPLTSLRRLRRKDGLIAIYRIKDNSFNQNEINRLNYHIRETRGNLLFSRCWVLVEGETDYLVFNECSRILGKDLVSEGVCCIEFTKIGVELFIKLAEQLGIEWLIVVDNDPSGEQYYQSGKKQLGNKTEGRHIHKLSHGDIEVHLCMEGYGHIFEKNISEQKKGSITASKGSLEYWKQVINAQPNKSKPKTMLSVIQEIEKRGSEGVPEQINKIINTALDLALETT